MATPSVSDIAAKINRHWSQVTRAGAKLANGNRLKLRWWKSPEVIKDVQINNYWSQVARTGAKTANGKQLKIRWWQSQEVIKDVNRRVCGEPLPGFSNGLNSLLKKRYASSVPFDRAVSVGGGTGNKEMALLRSGIIKHFDLYELSSERIDQGRKLALDQNLGDRITFHEADAFVACTEPDAYDLVHWNNSLHHMFDVDAAVLWSKTVLKPGGIFYMDDFVGQDRFQWSDEMLELCGSVRSALDDRLMVNPKHPRLKLSTQIKRPDRARLIEIDPSEAVESSKIPAAVLKHFPDADLKNTGGVIYHLVLNDVLHNLDEKDDAMTMNLLMIIDELASKLGENHYAVALAQKPLA